jgi:broad specificity phosphatase PhoE
VVPLGPGICIRSGSPPTVTVFDAQSCGGATTVRQGLELGDGGTAQMIGEPIRSVSLSAGAPPIVTVGSFGITVTLPMCVQVMTAFAFSAGNGIVGTSIRLRDRGDKRVVHSTCTSARLTRVRRRQMPKGPFEVVLVRHGETEWTRTRQHTGRTDLPLNDEGRRQAELVGSALAGRQFGLVLTSPLRRARETCELAGLCDEAQARDELAEWDYGEYEGRTTAEIRAERPDWSLWRDGVPGGESPDDVGRRADRVIDEVRAAGVDTLIFGHGHQLRVLAARWLGLAPADGRLLVLGTGSISILGYERETAALLRWNEPLEDAASPAAG